MTDRYRFADFFTRTIANKSYRVNVDLAYRPVLQISGPRTRYAYYDAAGNLSQLNAFNNTAQTFTYDALDELTGASDTQAGSYGNLSYTYIPNGHRKTETRNGTTTTYSYLGTNRLYTTNTQFWLYDDAGNVRSIGGSGYLTTDGYGRLTSALSGAANYAYNAFDQRTQKAVGGVTTFFHYGLNGELLYETDGTNNRVYVYLNDMPLGRIDNGQVYYYHTDPLGAPQVMTNAQGVVVWRGRYEPFGWSTVNEDPDGYGLLVKNNLRLAGQYYDSETGLHYNWNRYYDPKTGRYISSDPIGLRGGLNTYLYVKANPLRYIDPLGLELTFGQQLIVSGATGVGSAIGSLVPNPLGPMGGGAAGGAVAGALATALMPGSTVTDIKNNFVTGLISGGAGAGLGAMADAVAANSGRAAALSGVLSGLLDAIGMQVPPPITPAAPLTGGGNSGGASGGGNANTGGSTGGTTCN